MKNLKMPQRILSLLLSVAMLFSVSSTLVFADYDWQSETTNYDNEEILLPGTSEENGNVPEMKTVLVKQIVDDAGKKTYTKATDLTSFNIGDKIIVAIEANNFDRFQYNTTNPKSGLNTLSTALVYDTRYLRPTTEYVEDEGDYFFNQRIKSLMAADLYRWTLKTNRSVKFDGSYSLKDAYEAQTLSSGEVSSISSNSDVLRKVYTTYEFNASTSATPGDVQLSVINPQEFLIYYEFEIIDKPAEGEFSKGVSLSRSENMVVQFGENSNVNKTYTAVDGLHRYMKLTDGVNLWPPTYTVKFYNDDTVADDKQIGDDVTVPEDETIDSTKIPASDQFTPPEGKFFNTTDSWLYKKGDTATKFDPTKPITSAMVDENGVLKVYPNYVQGHTVTFHSNYSGDKIDHDTDPIDATATAYANPDGKGSVSVPEAVEGWSNTGYSIVGWKDAEGNDFTPGTTLVTNDMDLYAVWAQQVTVEFYKNDGTTETEAYAKYTISKGAKLGDDQQPTAPARTNYKFAEWNTKSNGSGTVVDTVNNTFSADTKVYAQWTPADGQETATLTFNAVLNDVTVNPGTVTVVKDDKVYTANIPVLEAPAGYTFKGWYKSAAINSTDKIDFDAGYAVSEDQNVYAHWSYEGADAKTVTFMNGDTQYLEVKVKPGESLGDAMPAPPTNANAAFKSWTTGQDGSGTEFKADTPVNENTTVYAQWTANVTVEYYENGGSSKPETATNKPAADTYVDPDISAMTKEGYAFVGWNTKQNGSGDYIKANTIDEETGKAITYAYVANKAGSANVKLYAQWAYVGPGDIDNVITNTPVTPKDGGVKVIFDSNVTGKKTGESVVPAYPSPKYLKLGDAFGNGNMPEEPVLTNYKFLSWNTKPDGSGKTVNYDTTFNEAGLGSGVLKEIADTNIAYEVTLYAQWDIDEAQVTDPDKIVTVTFNKNTDGNGTDSTPKVIRLFKGDSVGYDVADAEIEGQKFLGWRQGSISDGKLTLTNTAFDKNAAVEVSITYYAKWEVNYVAYVVDESKTVNEFTYTGSVIEPQFKIYKAVKSETSPGEYTYVKTGDPISVTDFDNNFVVTYQKGADDNATLKDAGTYSADVNFKSGSELELQGANIALVVNPKITIKKALLEVQIDPAKQIQKSGSATGFVAGTDIKVIKADKSELSTSDYDVKYQLWTDSKPEGGEKDGNIQGATELSEATTTVPANDAIGYYVVSVVPKDTNYTIDSVKTMDGKEGTPAKYIKTGESDYPLYDGAVEGSNIVYRVMANDPSADSLAVKGLYPNPDNPNEKLDKALTLKDNTYKTDKSFNNAEETTDDQNHYYLLVSKATTEIEVTVDPKYDTTTVKVKVGETEYEVKKNDDTGKYVASVPMKTATDESGNTKTIMTDISVVMTTSDGSASKTYLLTVKPSEAKITLEYGNSPYGEIMRDTKITDKDTAKSKFNENYKYATGYIPTGLTNTRYFSPNAWGDSENLDKNDFALFAIEYKGFVDPGFTAVDSLGEPVDGKDIERRIEVCVLPGQNMKVEITSEMYRTSVTTGEASNDTFFTNAQLTGSDTKVIQPDVYDMTYSFVDKSTGEKISETRKVVFLPMYGDTNLDNKVSSGDLAAVKNFIAKVYSSVDSTVKTSTYNLFVYRALDLYSDAKISSGDYAPIRNIVAKVPQVAFYQEFKK